MDKDLRAAIATIVIGIAIGIANYVYPTVKVTEIVPDIQDDHIYGVWVTVKNDYKERDIWIGVGATPGNGDHGVISLLPYKEKIFYAEFWRETKLEEEVVTIRVHIFLDAADSNQTDHPPEIRIEKTFQVH